MMIDLVKLPVVFNDIEHTYTYNGKQLSGITSLISRQLFPNKYDGIPESVLKNAAEKGSNIHNLCELYDDMGVTAEASELGTYVRLCSENKLHHLYTEYIVSDLERYASKIDKVYQLSDNEVIIADIKTTYKLDEEYVRWQCSIYAYLFELQNPNIKVAKIAAIWLRGEDGKYVELERIPSKIIKELLRTDAKGEQFVNNVKPSLPALPESIKALEKSIIHIENQVRYWKEQQEELKKGILAEMINAGVYKWESESISFTRRKETTTKKFDSQSFKTDYPELYQKYITETAVSGSLTIKVK